MTSFFAARSAPDEPGPARPAVPERLSPRRQLRWLALPWPWNESQYLRAARSWPAGSRLVQWARLDAEAARGGFAILVKANARFTHAASWGQFGVSALRINPLLAVWFLRTFYRHAIGFLGWDLKGLAAALQYVPGRAVDMGRVPAAGAWARVELPLERIGADGRLLDGVGFLHPRGSVQWGRTSILAPGGEELEVWGDDIQVAPDRPRRRSPSTGSGPARECASSSRIAS